MRFPRTMATVLASSAFLAFAPAAMATRYAAPGGTLVAACTFADPCSLTKAITGATVGDPVVRLFGGTYPVLPATVQTPVAGTDIAAEPGTGRPVIRLATGTQLRVVNGSRIADLDIVVVSPVGDALFMADDGTLAERLRLSGNAASMVKLGSQHSTSTLRDSIVVNTSTSPSASGVSIECNGCSTVGRVSNVTVVTSSIPALKAIADANGASSATLNVVNTIALATSGGTPDVVASAEALMGNDSATVNLDHSAYADSDATAPREHVNDLGGHVTAAPLLLTTATGDTNFTQLPGSPTIDAGTVSAFESGAPTDVFGLPRTLGAATDIGADETPGAPLVTTGAASQITSTGASVAGTVTPNGAGSAWRVEYGTTTAYGTTVGGSPATGAGFTGEAVAATLSGLTPGTTYHYRLAAQHSYGAGVGADATFTTGVDVPGGGGSGGADAGGAPGSGGTPVSPVPVIPTPAKPSVLPPLAKGCVSVRDFTIRLKRGVTATAVVVTVDGKRAMVTRGKTVRARVNLKGVPKKIVTVKIVVTAKGGKKTTTVRRYRTCSKKQAGANQVRLS